MYCEVSSEVAHHNCCFGGFCAFIAEGTTGAVNGLLQIFSGDNSESHGAESFGVETLYAGGSYMAYIVKVRSIAAYDAADCYYGVGVKGFDCARASEYELYSAGHGYYPDVVAVYSGFQQRVNGTVAEWESDVAVPLGAYYDGFESLGGSGYFFNIAVGIEDCRHITGAA